MHNSKKISTFVANLDIFVKMQHRIAIIAGGDSSEYGVSLRSAAGIYSFLVHAKYDLTIVCLRGSDWQALAETNKAMAENGGLVPTESPSWVMIDKNDFSYTYQGQKKRFDFAYITIHGTPGENGLLQGYFDMLRIPYSCCGVLAASLTFNKYMCNRYLRLYGVNTAQNMLLRKPMLNDSALAERIVCEVGLPCFIKSNGGGSSFGCTKVKVIEDVAPAIACAFSEGDEVICEAFLKGVEITCGAYKTSDKAVVFPITEVVTENEFFDYDAKYNGQVDEITPARIPDEVRDAVQALTLRVYDLLGCQGIIRIDYILTEGWKINMLEINTTPGMTATSFIPQQVRAAGLDMGEVLCEIIEDACSR